MLYDLSNYQVGDEFETSPYELSQIISAILAEGGSFDYEGSSIIITSLPQRKFAIKEDTQTIVEVVPDPEIATVSEPGPKKEVIPEPEPKKRTAATEKPKFVGRPRKILVEKNIPPEPVL